MKAPGGQQQRRGQADVIEFVPKPELERAQQLIEKQKLEIEPAGGWEDTCSGCM